ncbi:MAG: undecaprenyl-diphosphate phosphatase [Polyangiaceae bacterium]|nr:undecaprenyl-diphosphate phosphatase [Polyangiaceae bacterium]
MSSWLEALFLGFVQGVAEFLPISSSGVLALLGILLEREDAGLAFNLLLHAGTFVATLIVLRNRLWAGLRDGFQACRQPSLFTQTPGGQDALFVILASIPTAVIGLRLRDAVAVWSDSLFAVGIGFALTTFVLVSTLWAPVGEKQHPGWFSALLLGLVQGCAVAPGISRSGMTIGLALFLGVQRKRAFELSMLMSLPAVGGALILEGQHALGELNDIPLTISASVVAACTGIVAMLVLRRIVDDGRFSYFALWTGPLALGTLALAEVLPP